MIIKQKQPPYYYVWPYNQRIFRAQITQTGTGIPTLVEQLTTNSMGKDIKMVMTRSSTGVYVLQAKYKSTNAAANIFIGENTYYSIQQMSLANSSVDMEQASSSQFEIHTKVGGVATDGVLYRDPLVIECFAIPPSYIPIP